MEDSTDKFSFDLVEIQNRMGDCPKRAAFSLIQEGSLNLPDVGIAIVEHSRARLLNAAWLQESMTAS